MSENVGKGGWAVCQLGAREHYAIARALEAQGLLQKLVTDVWAAGVLKIAGTLGHRRLRALAGRFHPEIPRARVQAWTWRALVREACGSGRGRPPYQRFLEEGRWFGGLAKDWLRKTGCQPDTLFSYDTTALEVFESARERGIRCVLGQMDPGRFEADLVAEERERWPGWEAEALLVPDAYHERRAAEWALSDLIVVNSRWSREALLKQGVAGDKVRVVPLVYEPPTIRNNRQERHDPKGPLKVLFLGQVNLRKGIPYLLEAAGLAGGAVEVAVVGPIQISDRAIASAPGNVRFTGPVSRAEVASHYREADVFVLPTISDGFAITQLEAMAHGLPVIATRHCGEVVTDGLDGVLIPARDAQALAGQLIDLAGDRERVRLMSEAAKEKSREFSIRRLAACLREL